MKIHIVQKGDTLWKIAQKYGVNFEELKQVNSQLSNPDMIMPGMKIKVPTGSVPVKKKEMPKMPMEMAPVPPAPKKEMPKMPMPPMPKMPMPAEESPDIESIDYNIEQQMYNYTFNIPTYPTVPYMPTPEALPKKVKEVPTPEKPKVVAEVEKAPEEAPKIPAQPMPTMPAPVYPYHCVPVTGLLPGSGLPFGYQPAQAFAPYPTYQPYGVQPGFPPAVSPTTYAGDIPDAPELPDDIEMPEGTPGVFGQQPSFVANYTFPQGYPYGVQTPAVDPSLYGSADLDIQEQQYPGLSSMHAQAGQIPITGGAAPAGYGTPGYGAAPAGYGTPGYGAVPAGYGTPGYGAAPAGYGTPGYGAAPAGYGTPSYGTAPAGYGTPGYGAAPAGYGTPGYGAAPAGYGTPGYGTTPAGYETAPGGYGASAGLPYGPYQTLPFSPYVGEPPYREDEDIEESADW